MAALSAQLMDGTELSSAAAGTQTYGPFTVDQYSELALDATVEQLTATNLQLFIDRLDDQNNAYNLLSTATITAPGQAQLDLGPGLKTSANRSDALSIGRRVQVRVVQTGAGAAKYKLGLTAKSRG